MADFGDTGYGVFEPGTSREEQFTFTGISSNTITIGTRGLAMKSPYTNVAANQKAHAAGTKVILYTNSPKFYDSILSKANDETITGIYTFTEGSMPRISAAHTYGAGEEEFLATKRYVDSVVTGGAADASTTTKGLAEEATQAEVDARGTAGGTSARLFVNPSTLRGLRYHDFAASSAGSDTYAIDITPSISAYTDGDVFTFEADVANTGAATLNVDAVGAKTIKKYGAKDLESNDIVAGSIVQVVYDADSDTMMLLTPVGKQQISQNSSEIFASDAGANDTYAITLSPAPTAYVNGQVFNLFVNTLNTGAATLNVNALGAKTIKKNFNLDLETGDLVAGQIIQVVYDSVTDTFQLISPIVALPKVKTGQITTSGSTGAQSITGVGFKPKIVLFFHNFGASSGADQALSAMVGAATSASSRFVSGGYVSDTAGASGNSTDADKCITIRAGASASTVTDQADFTSMDADGFTINFGTATSARTILYVAIG